MNPVMASDAGCNYSEEVLALPVGRMMRSQLTDRAALLAELILWLPPVLIQEFVILFQSSRLIV